MSTRSYRRPQNFDRPSSYVIAESTSKPLRYEYAIPQRTNRLARANVENDTLYLRVHYAPVSAETRH